MDITLGIKVSDSGKTQKVKKEMSEDEANAIRLANEEIRANREKNAIV
jgi:hypothetical protein